MSEETALDHSSQFSLDFARKEGLRVVLPKANELQVDIDSDAGYAQFERAYGILRQNSYFVQGYRSIPSRNGGEGRHITVTLYHPPTPIERIALQAILGSDWQREAFSFLRLKDGDVIPTLFFEKP